jgi:Ca-activated chloride channel family protein
MLPVARSSRLLSALAFVAIHVAAQGWIEPIQPIRPLPPFPRGGIEKVRSAAQVAVTGRVAHVTVEEWFRNAGPALDEANYLYPLPGEAVFSDFSLWQGDRELKGEPMDAARARAIYEEIVRRKRDPALIELAGHGLVRARVFPIAPGETRKITLRYTQLLDRVGDAWRFRYPGAAGLASAGARSFRVLVDSAAQFVDPYSPTHRLTLTRASDRLEIALADTSAGSDVELFLPLAHGLVGVSFVGSQPAGEDGFFMLLVAPGHAREAPAVARDLVAVLDVSGSMSGEKLDQAKAALGQLLGTLRSGDRFRLIAFSSGVERYAAGWTGASGDHQRAAQDWVRHLEAGGGTNIAGALAEAFAAPPADGALGVVVFLTDGMPTVGETDPERIVDQAEHRRGPFRVFAFGIGYDVNTYLLDRLTEGARGVTAYIQPGGDIEQAVGSLAAKVASPVLTDLAISADGVELYDLEPQSLPDLFAGDELVVFGRYRGAGSGERAVTVAGRRNGREERFATVARFGGEGAGRTAYVQQLWAARKAGALSRQVRLHGPNPEIVEELKRLALRYGILTEYTAYLVQEPSMAWGPAPQALDAATRVLERGRPVGAGAVASSARDAKLLRSDVVAFAVDSLGGTAGQAAHGNATRRVGARLFELRDSVWLDAARRDSVPTVRVAPFSDAYFALLSSLPELVRPAALGPAVLVAGRRVAVEIQVGGKTTWADGELAALVRAFRP